MIGDFTYKSSSQKKLVYGHSLWRTPHNPTNSESGIGLASEFGCSDDGATCNGYHVTNGVLGYESAQLGEPFLIKLV